MSKPTMQNTACSESGTMMFASSGRSSPMPLDQFVPFV
jgi:hypothetical protein